MNENLNLVEILKDCPVGTKLYSPIFGDVEFDKIDIHSDHPIRVLCKYGDDSFAKDGRMFFQYDGECTLFPSKEQRDWSKFKPKKPKFDPKTLQPFDKVLVMDKGLIRWRCTLYSNLIEDNETTYKYVTAYNIYKYCIPYNDDTKYLVGTNKEAPEFYRYWED